ncbi:hypothetical protein MNBD_GAMMA10-1665 [hydrothermal vent metagenome]|uniref:Type IX secretion system membrane protein PorP/SprF n=1 Tax=hydrothermal vent metagenome TaxID=652676 RepID=A0A3B0XVE5_9ZZZZ
MFQRSLLTGGLLLAVIPTVQALPYGFFDARSVAMGNVSMATGGVTTAALSNPGMLMVNEYDDSYALLLPAIGVQVIDDGNVIDQVDEFQALNGSTDPNDLMRQRDILLDIEDDSVVGAIIPNVAFVSSGENFTWGITYRANAVVSATITDLVDVNPVGLNPDGTVSALGVVIQEIGLPMGSAVSLAGMQLSFGITPRYVQIDVIEYSESITTADLEDIQDTNSEDLGSFATFDAGVVLNVAEAFRVGLVAKNLIEETKTTSIGREIDFETHLRAGAALDLGLFTLAADMDLTERKPIAGENPSKSFSVGAEFDIFNTVQFRAGYQTNTASGATDPDLLSLGVGIWLGFNLDIAAVVGDDSTFGGFIQTGFHF